MNPIDNFAEIIIMIMIIITELTPVVMIEEIISK